MNRQLKKQGGLTLIEVMISMVVGLVLLGGTISMFIANKRVYKEQESMARLQENSRFALEMMIKDIRMIGYTGCADELNSVQNHVNGATGSNILAFENPAEGSENGNNWVPSGSSDVTGSILPNTDGITIRYLDNRNLNVKIPYMVTPSADLHIKLNNGLVQGEIVGVFDCESVDVFQISNADPSTSGSVAHNTGVGTPGNATKPLQKKYGAGATIVRFISRRYYIGTGSYGGPSLFREVFSQDRDDSDSDGDTMEVIQHSEELIEGVENMQILYGEDTTGDRVADTYVKADSVSNWSNIISVRIALLMRTINPNPQIGPDLTVYTMLGGTAAGGVTVGPMNDFYRRRIFTSTIQIRNRSR
jgi:type IV pilus assembly protein PilW